MFPQNAFICYSLLIVDEQELGQKVHSVTAFTLLGYYLIGILFVLGANLFFLLAKNN